MAKILIIEDDSALSHIVHKYLTDAGYFADSAQNPGEAFDLMEASGYDLIISDIMMPEIDGFEFAESVRQTDKNIPILFMSARDDFPSKKKGYQIGIDDYMVKPVDMEELVLKVGALLRRAGIEKEKRIVIGTFTMDAEQRSASVNGTDIALTKREFDILFKMLSYPKKTFSRQALMDEFWDLDSESSLRAVDLYITKIRDKFSSCDEFQIVTIHGMGYKAIFEA